MMGLISFLVLSGWLAAPALAQTSSATLPAATVAAPVNTSSTSVSGAPAPSSPWGLSYYNFGSVNSDVANYGGASWSVYQYFSLNYKMNKDERFTVRAPFTTKTSGFGSDGQNQQMSTTAGEFQGTYSNYSLAKLPGDWNLSGTFYGYLPTSESAQEKRWAARVSSWLIFEKKINSDWTITYNAKPDYYFNTQKAYRAERPQFNRATGETTIVAKYYNNMIGKYDQYFELSRRINDTFTPFVASGVIHEWYYPSDQTKSGDSLVETFKVAPGTWINVNQQLRFIVAAEDRINLRDRRGGDARLFRDNETQYYFMTFWTIL